MDEKDSETPVNTFQEFDDCENELGDIMKSMKELNETYNSEFKELQQKFKSTLKEMKSEVSKFKKSIKKLSKTKKRNKNAGKPNKSGFNEPRKIPKILEKFIGKELLAETDYQENDSKLSRTKVFSLWQKKLKAEGCKEGKKLVINNKVAKALKLKIGTKYNFSEQHTLLATFYPSKVNKNNV
jgi:hypothetical protein